MTASLLGRDVRGVRQALGLSVNQFASVLGVHQSSVARWEAAADSEVRIEGVPLNVLTALRQRVKEIPKKEAGDIGKQVVQALIVGGALAALVIVISNALKGK